MIQDQVTSEAVVSRTNRTVKCGLSITVSSECDADPDAMCVLAIDCS